MNVLIACEESQAVCKEFRKRGHRAFSCDILECSGGRPDWHIKGDVLPLLNGKCEFTLQNGQTDRQTDRWDLIIAFPPCTHLAVSGARWFTDKRQDGRQRGGIEFFAHMLNADCEKIAVENPVGIISGDYVKKWFPDLAEKYGLPRKASQTIHPWQFGDEYEKTTDLWLKGLPLLEPDNIVGKGEFIVHGSGKKKPKWYADAFKLPPEERAKVRSKTFPGIARAMAEQWG